MLISNLLMPAFRNAPCKSGGAVCKGATPLVEQPGGRGFKPRLQSLLD